VAPVIVITLCESFPHDQSVAYISIHIIHREFTACVACLVLTMVRISLDFLEKGHLHQLDGYLSPETQSIALEVIFWALSYTLFVQIFSRVIRNVYRRTKIWNYARQREGVFLGNGRDDAVLLTCLGIHHGFAAYLMYKGMTTNRPNTWRHGFLVETGFEVSDYVAIILGIYPFAKHDGFKDDIKLALVAHHVPGVVLSVFVMETGAYTKIDTCKKSVFVSSAVPSFHAYPQYPSMYSTSRHK